MTTDAWTHRSTWTVTEPLHGSFVSSTLNGGSWLCPDLLHYQQIGVADNWRGRVVRAFFWLMRAWPV